MPRINRGALERGFFHVPNRGNHRQSLFADAGEYGAFPELLATLLPVPRPRRRKKGTVGKRGQVQLTKETTTENVPVLFFAETKVGANGQPIKGQPELSATQKKVVKDNKSLIRKTVKKIGKYLENEEKESSK